MTQEELGAKVGVKKAAIYKYETGLVVNLKREVIDKLSEVLEVSPSYLMGLDDESEATEYPKTQTQLDDIYLSFAKTAQDEGIDPQDIKDAIELIKRLRQQ